MAVRCLSGRCSRHLRTDVTARLAEQIDADGQGQNTADERMVGRVFGLDTTMSTLSMPLGMLIFAPLADVIPISLVFIIGGVLTLPIGIYLFGQARHNTSAQVTRTQA